MLPSELTIGVLAGGRGERLGGEDKGLLKINGKPMISYCLAPYQPQQLDVVVSANRNQDNYSALGYSTISDGLYPQCGPLSGVIELLNYSPTPWIACLATDALFTSPNWLNLAFARAQLNSLEAVVVSVDGIANPTCGLYSRTLFSSLNSFLSSGRRAAQQWLKTLNHETVDYSENEPWIWSVNTPLELKNAEHRLSAIND